MHRHGSEATRIGDATDQAILGVAAPAHYPRITSTVGGASALLEGAIYDCSPVEASVALDGFATAFARDPDAARGDIERWASARDGDFVLALVTPNRRRALIVNDCLGRLPVYWQSKDGAVALAREVKFVRARFGAGEPDRQAIAEMLMFTCTLGTRTLHRDIERLPEACSALVDCATGAVDIRRYLRWEFEQIADRAPRALETEAHDLVERFGAACAAQVRWSAGRPIVLGLSGGLDSRAVASGLTNAGAAYEAVTFVSQRKKADEEAKTSREIARRLGVPWHEYVVGSANWQNAARLAALRDGLSPVGLAFMYDYFERVRERFGDATVHFTGDGGDRAMPDLRADVPVRNREGFLGRRLAETVWSPADAAALLGMRPATIVDGVRAHFEAYPERNPAAWEMRFAIADYAANRLFGGEDRNRSFLWNIAPFYSQSFFKAALAAPMSIKRHYALYARFLEILNPAVARVAKSNWGFSASSPLVRVLDWMTAAQARAPRFIRTAIGAALPEKQRPRGFGTPVHDPDFAALAAAYSGGVFNRYALAGVTQRGCNRTHFFMLATALLYAEQTWPGASPQAPQGIRDSVA